ncbi:uncharacterized protein LOC133293138 [Gastrolobium bilobum]|uniref:uncharacterized protein LOC133293138 n=1 Tax=Gastrolobium bilobum TaxID=150636 RepID=UPI002AB0BA86|nr:uncharacterized protein LOC133293138 [Gastrolobium bilobum]
MAQVRLGKKLKTAKKAWKSFSKTLNIPKDIKAINATFTWLLPSRGRATRPFAAAASNYNVHSNNMSTIPIDDLFAEPASDSMHVHAYYTHAQGETIIGNEVIGSSVIETLEDAWRVVVANSPQLQVYERAEQFISMFYEDLRIQKEMSLLEFQEMLARGI